MGLPHHVTQRGNNRALVFFSNADRKRYLSTLAGYCEESRLKVWAYCLMGNHVHIVAVPERDSGHRADESDLHAVCESPVRQDRASLAESVLFRPGGLGPVSLGGLPIC